MGICICVLGCLISPQKKKDCIALCLLECASAYDISSTVFMEIRYVSSSAPPHMISPQLYSWKFVMSPRVRLRI